MKSGDGHSSLSESHLSIPKPFPQRLNSNQGTGRRPLDRLDHDEDVQGMRAALHYAAKRIKRARTVRLALDNWVWK